MKPKATEFGLLIVDIQGKLAKIVENHQDYLNNTEKLIKCCQQLSIPIVGVEQNPAGLGGTTPQIKSLLPELHFHEKYHFNALAEPHIQQALQDIGKKHWLVVGIEAHICVYQTVQGLLANGYQVTILADCIAARKQANVTLALAELRHQGVEVSALEMLVYQLLESSQNPLFKKILAIIK